MSGFPYAFSSASDWTHVADEISDGLTMSDAPTGGVGLLYVTDHFAGEFQQIAAILRQKTGLQTWVGTLGLGVIGGAEAVFDRPGAARGAVYISCVARGPEMFGTETAEAELISAGLHGTPVIGFYAGGEISNDRLYGYTGVLLVFG